MKKNSWRCVAHRWVKAWLIFAIPALILLTLGCYLDVVKNGFSGSDESSHFVSSYFITEYLRQGNLTNPMTFAEQFYIAYPKLAIGHWPPLYYIFVGGLFLFLPAAPETAALINLTIIAISGSFLALLIRPVVGFGWSLAAAVIFTLLPLTSTAANFFLLDQPLTLMILLAAWVWWLFSSKPSYTLGLVYGVVAAAAILLKGNGWALGLFPIVHIILAQRWILLRDPRTYAGALVCLLLVVPWYMVTTKIAADGFNYSFGISYASEALKQNLLTFYYNIGAFGLALAVFGVVRLWSVIDGRKEQSSLVRVATSMIVAVLLLQSLVPVAIVPRYMAPALPFLLSLSILGIVELKNIGSFRGRVPLTRGFQVIALMSLIWPGLVSLSYAKPQVDLRMADVAKMVVSPTENQVVVIDGSPGGEGAFIAEALVASNATGIYVARSSKILSSSNFMGENYQLLVQEPEDVGIILRNLGAQYVVLERQKGGNRFPHSAVMENFLNDPDSGYQKLVTLKYRWRQGATHIYIATSKLIANIQAVEESNFPQKRKLF